jgi:hypothetical protein
MTTAMIDTDVLDGILLPFDKRVIISSLARESGGLWRYSLEEFRVVLLAPRCRFGLVSSRGP